MDLQICELEEILKGDDKSMSPEEFMKLIKSRTTENPQLPAEDIDQCSLINAPEKFVEGEISRMLQNNPDILQPVDRLPKLLSESDSSGRNNQSQASGISDSSTCTVIFNESDHTNIPNGLNPSIAPSQPPQKTAQTYFNARQLYVMKRGKKQK